MLIFKKSTRKYKKYMVKTPNGHWVHFGDKRYQQFKDRTPLKLYSYLDHNNKKRRENYLSRAKGIRDKEGDLTYNNKESPNYYSIHYLW